MILEARNISYSVSGKKILTETSQQLEPGCFHVIMGANGAGKSTLLKLLAGSLKPDSGQISLGGNKLSSFTHKSLARQRAVLSQHYSVSFPLTAFDIVMMGRYPYYEGSPRPEDYTIVRSCLDKMEITDLEERDYNTLSGGEAQKVQMSRVLAQLEEEGAASPKILFLDEPVSHLDIKYQHQLLRMASGECKKGNTVFAVLHDINLALRYAHRIHFMKAGRIRHTIHHPGEVNADLLREIFDVDSSVIYGPAGLPVVVF